MTEQATFIFGDSTGEHYEDEELKELGLDAHTKHVKLQFDNPSTIKYQMWALLLKSLLSVSFFPIYLLFFPCIYYGVKTSMNFRQGAVTEKQVVSKNGVYGCCCCFWNVNTKSVPLNQITDCRLQQGCVQRCFDIKEIVLETASSTKGMPELTLVGVKDADNIRRMILRARDQYGVSLVHSYDSSKNKNTSDINPLLSDRNNNNNNNNNNYNGNAQIMQMQVETNNTLSEIRDLLIQINTKFDQKK